MLTLTAPPLSPRVEVVLRSPFGQHIKLQSSQHAEREGRHGSAGQLCMEHLTQAAHIMSHRPITHHEAFQRRHRINLCDGGCYLLTDSIQRVALMKCISCPKYSKNKCYNKSCKLPETFFFVPQAPKFPLLHKAAGRDGAAFHVAGGEGIKPSTSETMCEYLPSSRSSERSD